MPTHARSPGPEAAARGARRRQRRRRPERRSGAAGHQPHRILSVAAHRALVCVCECWGGGREVEARWGLGVDKKACFIAIPRTFHKCWNVSPFSAFFSFLRASYAILCTLGCALTVSVTLLRVLLPPQPSLSKTCTRVTRSRRPLRRPWRRASAGKAARQSW